MQELAGSSPLNPYQGFDLGPLDALRRLPDHYLFWRGHHFVLATPLLLSSITIVP